MDYETFMEVIKSRRSVRRFTDQNISHKQIEQLIETACWAPSNHNRQGWKFIIFENKEEIKKLTDQIRQFIKKSLTDAHRLVVDQTEELVHYSGAFDQAPVVILIMHKKSPVISRSILDLATSDIVSGEAISASMAAQNLLLAAHVMGLGACIMTAPLLAGQVWDSLKDMPLGFEPTCLIALGYPDETPDPPRRKKLEHVIEYR